MVNSLKRILALTKMEVLLLLRNRTTLFYAIAIAPLTVLLLWWLFDLDQMDSSALAGMLITALVGIALTMVVYYNLTTTVVARREELMLKRTLTGPSSLAEVLTAMATPAFVIMVGQLVAGMIAAGLLLEVPVPVNMLWILVALIGGTAMFALCAYASSSFTRSVEAAQLTTMPFLMIVLLTSGIFLPLEMFGEIGAQIAALTPLASVVTLLNYGFGMGAAGNQTWSGMEDVGIALVAMALWILLAGWYMQRRMPIEPRR